jgi:hypothetical protein
MKKLAKIHRDFILKMIQNGDKVSYIKAYCKGAGFDTDNYSSPVFISQQGKMILRYRNINSYYYIKI